MDIRGVNRIKSFLGLGTDPQRSKISQSSEQRGGGNQNQRKDSQQEMNLNQEQLDQAFGVLLQSLEGSGLSAEQVISNGQIVFVVKNPNGDALKKLGAREITELYLKRKMDPQPGSILKRSA